MAELPLIPTPPAQRWREFRIQNLPVLVFATAFLCAFYLWRESVTPATLVGEVETIRADETSPDSGLLTNLWVTRFQPVKAGDVVAEVMATDSPAFIPACNCAGRRSFALEVGPFWIANAWPSIIRCSARLSVSESNYTLALNWDPDHEYKAAGDLLNVSCFLRWITIFANPGAA